MIIALTIILGVFFSKELWERKKPVLAYSTSESKGEINFKDAYILFYFQANNEIKFEINDYFDVKILQHQYTVETNEMVEEDFSLEDMMIEIKKDEINSYGFSDSAINAYEALTSSLDKNSSGDLQSYRFYMINPTITEKINFSYKESKGRNRDFKLVQVGIYPCGYIYNTKTNCKDMETIYTTENGKEIYYNIYNLETILRPLEYSNSKSSYFKSYANTQIARDSSKVVYLHFSNNEFHRDDSWLIERNEIENYIKKETHSEHLIGQFAGFNFQYYFLLNDSSQITVRYYQKIQDLFARIGGISNAFFFFFNMVLSNFYNFKFHLNTFNLTWMDKFKYEKSLHDENKYKFNPSNLNINNESNIERSNISKLNLNRIDNLIQVENKTDKEKKMK